MNRMKHACWMVGVVAALLISGCQRPEPAATDADSGMTPPTAPPVAVAPKVDQAPVLPARDTVIEPSAVRPVDYAPAGDIEVFGNFHTAGIIATLPDGMDVAGIGSMRAYLNVGGDWERVQDPVQVGSFGWYASSLFWLKPDSLYQVKVEVVDHADTVIATWYGEGRTRPDATVSETTTSLYVATHGSDDNSGTMDKPLKTIAHALSVAQAGTTIFVREGIYYTGDLVFPHNGRAGSPIVLRGYPQETVVIDAADPALMDASLWKPIGGGLYQHAFPGQCYNVTLVHRKTGERTRLIPLRSVDQLTTRNIPDHGSFEALYITGAFNVDGQTATLMPPTPLENYVVHIAQHTKGFILENRKHIQIANLEIRHFGKDDYSTGAILYNSSDILFDHCRFIFDDTGIWVKMNSDRVTIQDCTFLDGILQWPFGMLKMGGAVASFEAGSVNVDAKFSGRGLVFRRNHIQGLFDGAHLTSWTVDDAKSNEIDFYENVVLDCVDDFIEIDGFSRNVRVFDNTMNRSLSGISLAQALDGPTYMIYNLLANCGDVPAAQREENYGYPFKTNGGPQSDIGSGPMYFYHNTSYTSDPHSRAMLVKRARWKNMVLRNNIWCGHELGFEIWEAEPSPMDFDYDNLYVSTPGAPLVVRAYHNKYNSLASVRIALKWLQHGISADPLLKNAAADDYRLSDESPCIDAGIEVAGINKRRTMGTAPDMGAYEQR